MKLLTQFTALCLTALLLTSCNKSPLASLGKAIQYDLDMQSISVDVVIPAYADTNISVNGTQANYCNVDSFIKANTANLLGIDNITEVHLMSCRLKLSNADAANNFGDFSSASGSFYTNSEATPYIAVINANPANYADSLQLPVDASADLKKYINAATTTFNYTLAGKLRKPTTKELHCTMTCNFKVHVQGLKQE